MDNTWTLKRIENLIKDNVEENFELEYKGAGALSRDDGKKIEITKDVSALANSAGGFVIYGIGGYDKKSGKEHYPEKIDPIRRNDFSKESLQQVISQIQPRIDGIIITPVEVDSEYVIYVVDVPKGKTAHQATDKKYYRRYNSISEAMNDYEIRDVMNRSATPDVDVEFSYSECNRINIAYYLNVNVINNGILAVNHFKLMFYFPYFDSGLDFINSIDVTNPVTRNGLSEGMEFTYKSQDILFPEDMAKIEYLDFYFPLNGKGKQEIREKNLKIIWHLYADNMIPKRGEIPVLDLKEV